MSDLTLPQRLLVRIGQISQRSDVIVQQQSTSRAGGNKLGKWQSKLPADMFAFYQTLNGLKFHYSFADAPDGYHGLEFVALDEGGRKMIDTFRNIYRVPHQAAKRYPEYFFQAGEVDPNAQVLFFFGSDDAWGVIMKGEGESASFHHWDNDGYVKYLSGSFTELVERLMARGFAHTWAYSDSHPDTDEVVRRLAIEVPPRKTCELTVESLEVRSSADYRRGVLATFTDDQHTKALRALGLAKQAKGLAQEERIALLEGACSSVASMDEKTATSVMKAFGYLRRTRDEMAAFFRCDGGPVAYLALRLERIDGPEVWLGNQAVLLRVLHSIPGFQVTADFPHPPDVLRFLELHRHNLSWNPFVAISARHATGEEKKRAIFNVVLDASRAQGMEVGKTYPSSALLAVEARIG